jgi:HSP20 family protein
MKVTKAAPRQITTVRDDFERLFDRMLGGGLFGPPAPVFETMWSPSVDFSENEKEYLIRLEAPGVAKEDLEVNLDGQTLTLSGRRDFAKEEKTEEYFWREREQGRFVRTIQFPTPVDASKVDASYADGVLTVKVPKTEPAIKNRIAIK